MEELSLSKNVANLRKKKGVTQETLAEFIGVTKKLLFPNGRQAKVCLMYSYCLN